MDTNKTPNCDMREALVSYLYDEANDEETRRVEMHLNECAVCKQEMHAFQNVRGMLQQWQLNELPAVRVVRADQDSPRRSVIGALRELFTIMPLWTKAIGAAAMALLVLAVMGTEVKIGREGFSMRADMLGRQGTAEPATSQEPDATRILTRAEVKAMVNEMILESDRQHRDELRAQLVSLESQLENMKSADLMRLAARIQEQQARIKTIERDIDRREGLNLADILFSEMTTENGEGAGAQSGGD